MRRSLLQQQGIALNTLERYDEALPLLTAATDPSENGTAASSIFKCVSRGWVDRALSAFHLKRHAEAVSAYTAATKIDPKYAVAYSMQGQLLMHVGRNVAAARSFGMAVRLNETDVDSWQELGKVQRRLQRWKDAAFSWSVVASLRPSASALIERAMAVMILGRHDEAREGFKQARRMNPSIGQRLDDVLATTQVCPATGCASVKALLGL